MVDIMGIALDEPDKMRDILVPMGFNGLHEICHDCCCSFRLDCHSLRYATSSSRNRMVFSMPALWAMLPICGRLMHDSRMMSSRLKISAGVPSAMMCLLAMTTMRSKVLTTKSMSCVMTTTPTPRSCR